MNKTSKTFWAKVYLSGPVEVAKQILRRECLVEGLCVTIDPTTFIYTGGEEAGYVVGFLNYPRFEKEPEEIAKRVVKITEMLVDETFQHSALIMTDEYTTWVSKRVENENTGK